MNYQTVKAFRAFHVIDDRHQVLAWIDKEGTGVGTMRDGHFIVDDDAWTGLWLVHVVGQGVVGKATTPAEGLVAAVAAIERSR
jgi:hypothetical protein